MITFAQWNGPRDEMGAIPAGHVVLRRRGDQWYTQRGHAVSLTADAVMFTGYYTDAVLVAKSSISRVDADIHPDYRRDRGDPPDDCPCGCEGDHEHHIGARGRPER